MTETTFFPYFSLVLTLAIGGAAAYLGFLQQRTNALRLKHELFERRYKIYDSFSAFIGGVMREGKTSHEACVNFLRETKQAEFLFGPEIPEYLTSVFQKGLDLLNTQRRLFEDERLPVGEERSRVAHEEMEIMKWFGAQFEIARVLFGKYLNLTRLK